MSDPKPRRPSLFQIFISVIAAMFGVQSERARVRDFSQGHPMPYIVVGILLIVLFVFTIAFIVRTVLAMSGAL